MKHQEHAPYSYQQQLEQIKLEIDAASPSLVIKLKKLFAKTTISYNERRNEVVAAQPRQMQELFDAAPQVGNLFHYTFESDARGAQTILAQVFVDVWFFLKEKDSVYKNSLEAFEQSEDWEKLLLKVAKHILGFIKGTVHLLNYGEFIFDNKLREILGVKANDVTSIFTASQFTKTYTLKRAYTRKGYAAMSTLPAVHEAMGLPVIVRRISLPQMDLDDTKMEEVLSFFSVPEAVPAKKDHLNQAPTISPEVQLEPFWEDFLAYQNIVDKVSNPNSIRVKEDILRNSLVFLTEVYVRTMGLSPQALKLFTHYILYDLQTDSTRMSEDIYEDIVSEMAPLLKNKIRVRIPYSLTKTYKVNFINNDVDRKKNKGKKKDFLDVRNDLTVEHTTAKLLLSFVAYCEISADSTKTKLITEFIPNPITDIRVGVVGQYSRDASEASLIKVMTQAMEDFTAMLESVT